MLTIGFIPLQIKNRFYFCSSKPFHGSLHLYENKTRCYINIWMFFHRLDWNENEVNYIGICHMLVFCLNCTLLSTQIWFSIMVQQGCLFLCVSVPAFTLCPIKCYWLKQRKYWPSGKCTEIVLKNRLRKCDSFTTQLMVCYCWAWGESHIQSTARILDFYIQ